MDKGLKWGFISKPDQIIQPMPSNIVMLRNWRILTDIHLDIDVYIYIYTGCFCMYLLLCRNVRGMKRHSPHNIFNGDHYLVLFESLRFVGFFTFGECNILWFFAPVLIYQYGGCKEKQIYSDHSKVGYSHSNNYPR